MIDEIVNAQALRRSFCGRTVLADVNLKVKRGEFVAVLGASGTGKSTLLRILAGLDNDASGSLTLPRHRAMMFQEPRLLPWKRVAENINLGLAKISETRTFNVLSEVGLGPEFAKRWPVNLSGGEAQRVALARALVSAPDLLLLDEPFGALDALTRIRMQDLLRQVHDRHQSAVLLVTHDVEEAVLLADRVVVLAEGQFIRDLRIELPKSRHRSDREVIALREQLLETLGVFESSSDFVQGAFQGAPQEKDLGRI